MHAMVLRSSVITRGGARARPSSWSFPEGQQRGRSTRHAGIEVSMQFKPVRQPQLQISWVGDPGSALGVAARACMRMTSIAPRAPGVPQSTLSDSLGPHACCSQVSRAAVPRPALQGCIIPPTLAAQPAHQRRCSQPTPVSAVNMRVAAQSLALWCLRQRARLAARAARDLTRAGVLCCLPPPPPGPSQGQTGWPLHCHCAWCKQCKQQR